MERRRWLEVVILMCLFALSASRELKVENKNALPIYNPTHMFSAHFRLRLLMIQVQKWQIYDITNVLEGIGLIEKKLKNRIHWNIAVGFYILLRAIDRFAANYNSFPGQFNGEMDEDISRLKTTAVSLLSDLGCNGSTLTEDHINEMCRYGAAELHAVAAFIGGIASQEVIKELDDGKILFRVAHLYEY